MLALIRSEATKISTARSSWILILVTVIGTWLMSWTNAASSAGLPPDSDLLFSTVPVPLAYTGFDMATFGHPLIVAFAALWAGSEYGSGQQIRTTLLATPKRGRVFLVKTGLLALTCAVSATLTMSGGIMISHAAGDSPLTPWTLTPEIWGLIGGLSLAWTLSGVISFAIGTLARSAIIPLILIVPLSIGLGDFLAQIWSGARYLPTAAGAALYSDPATGIFLPPAAGALVLLAWAATLTTAAGITFARRDQ